MDVRVVDSLVCVSRDSKKGQLSIVSSNTAQGVDMTFDTAPRKLSAMHGPLLGPFRDLQVPTQFPHAPGFGSKKSPFSPTLPDVG